jgi:tetraacyldisaccharide 4'-kinase
MRAPAFWQHGKGPWPRLLAPFAVFTAMAGATRMAKPGWRAPVPVLCVGNATVGGAGKTTVVLDLVARLKALGVAVHVLSRGYGGAVGAAHRVDPRRDTARDVGDEPLLLAEAAPTWVGADRAASARAALAAGAEALVMDDGLQNPSLQKTAAMLVIDGEQGFGNGRLLPAGPLREPPSAAAARASVAVLIGADKTGALACLPPGLPLLRARLAAGAEAAALAGTPVLAFAGIAHPQKFQATLREAGLNVLRCVGFADHAQFSPRALARLAAEAKRLGARLVTTPKDAVRLPAAFRAEVSVIGVGLVWEDEAALQTKLAAWMHEPLATA